MRICYSPSLKQALQGHSLGCCCSEVVDYKPQGIRLQGVREKEQALFLIVANQPYAWLYGKNLPYSLCCRAACCQISLLRAWKQDQEKKITFFFVVRNHFFFSEEKIYFSHSFAFFITAWNSAKLEVIKLNRCSVPTYLSVIPDRKKLHGMRRLICVMVCWNTWSQTFTAQCKD